MNGIQRLLINPLPTELHFVAVCFGLGARNLTRVHDGRQFQIATQGIGQLHLSRTVALRFEPSMALPLQVVLMASGPVFKLTP